MISTACEKGFEGGRVLIVHTEAPQMSLIKCGKLAPLRGQRVSQSAGGFPASAAGQPGAGECF
jgi:hypothetical protein